jgi:hypothetical protein
MKSSTVGRGFDVGIEADTTSDGQNFEGSLPSIVNIAWDVSDDAKNTATFFTRFDKPKFCFVVILKNLLLLFRRLLVK